jgi:class 3 adenylate cyclase
VKPPPIRYAPGPDGRIAYQIVGEGQLDLLLVPAGRANLDVVWEEPGYERFLRRLSSFSRLVIVNARGTGLSDPIPLGAPLTLEDWMMDFRWVLDDAGSERAAVMAMDWVGMVAVLFAATFPERVSALTLVNCVATMRRAEGYPWGFPEKALNSFLNSISAGWGTGENLRFMAPDLWEDPRFREWFARLERLSTTHGALSASRVSVSSWDVRGILPSIKAPTLVISHTEVPYLRLGHGRYLAEHIPNARYLERPGFWGGVYWLQDIDWLIDEVRTFLTGSPGAADLDDRVLSTVLFTDIVSSTERAAELGDDRWRRLLDQHDALVGREIERFRGRQVKWTGDGVLATFDGPARAIRCAASMRDVVRALGIEVRMGLHTGEIELRADDVGGIAVHIGARVMAEAGPNEILVSGAVPPLVAGSGLEFEDRGVRELKGVPGEWRLFAVSS